MRTRLGVGQRVMMIGQVKAGIMRHQRQPLDERHHPLPHKRKHRCILRILGRKAVHPLAEPLVILRLRVDQAVERVHDLAVTDDYHPHAAHAAGALIRSLEIYRGEVSHNAPKVQKTCNFTTQR